MSRVNIVKRIKIGGRWKMFSILRNAKGNYDWNAIADGRYYVEWYAGGTRRRVSAGVTAAQALEVQRRKHHELESRKLGIPGFETAGETVKKPALHVAITKYLEQIEALKKPNTHRKYEAPPPVPRLSRAQLVRIPPGSSVQDDGVGFVRGLGADEVVDGYKEDVLAAARRFAPNGLDAVLLTTGGEAAENSLAALRAGGRVAYPNGVQPVPKERAGIKLQSYDGEYNPPPLDKVNRLIEAGPFEVKVARTFTLDQAADAQRALNDHYLGKLALITK